MKKSVVILLVVLLLTACGAKQSNEKVGYQPRVQKEVGIKPYELSDRENFIQKTLGLGDNARIYTYRTPKETRSYSINKYKLKSDNTWESGGGIFSNVNVDGSASEKSGVFAVAVKTEKNGDYSYNVFEITLDDGRTTIPFERPDNMLSEAKKFIEEFREIKLNQEIPVLMVKGLTEEGGMTGCDLNDYFNPGNLSGADYVEVVTIVFSDKGLEELTP